MEVCVKLQSETIESGPHPRLPPGSDSFDRLVQGLRRKDQELNLYCTVVLIRLQHESGFDVVPRLADEAAAKGKHPDFRIRILEAIRQIGVPLNESFFEVWSLINHPVERVSRKAAEVVDALKPASLNQTRRLNRMDSEEASTFQENA